jgi:hypothetical protein
MANMSYCRWENTSNDMQDCVEAQREGFDPADASEYEQRGFYACLRAAAEMLAQASPEQMEEAGLDASVVEAVRGAF